MHHRTTQCNVTKAAAATARNQGLRCHLSCFCLGKEEEDQIINLANSSSEIKIRRPRGAPLSPLSLPLWMIADANSTNTHRLEYVDVREHGEWWRRYHCLPPKLFLVVRTGNARRMFAVCVGKMKAPRKSSGLKKPTLHIVVDSIRLYWLYTPFGESISPCELCLCEISDMNDVFFPYLLKMFSDPTYFSSF